MRIPYPNELWHYGILGQKWGVRRFQNPDGTLTSAGKKRYLNTDGTVTEDGKRRNAEFEKSLVESESHRSSARKILGVYIKDKKTDPIKQIAGLEESMQKHRLEMEKAINNDDLAHKIIYDEYKKFYTGKDYQEYAQKALDKIRADLDEELADLIEEEYSMIKNHSESDDNIWPGPSPYNPFTLYANDHPKVQKTISDAENLIQNMYKERDRISKSVCDDVLGEYGNLEIKTDWGKKNYTANDTLDAFVSTHMRDYVYENRNRKTSNKDLFEEYLKLHPNSELTLNEFNNWFYES